MRLGKAAARISIVGTFAWIACLAAASEDEALTYGGIYESWSGTIEGKTSGSGEIQQFGSKIDRLDRIQNKFSVPATGNSVGLGLNIPLSKKAGPCDNCGPNILAWILHGLHSASSQINTGVHYTEGKGSKLISDTYEAELHQLGVSGSFMMFPIQYLYIQIGANLGIWSEASFTSNETSRKVVDTYGPLSSYGGIVGAGAVYPGEGRGLRIGYQISPLQFDKLSLTNSAPKLPLKTYRRSLLAGFDFAL